MIRAKALGGLKAVAAIHVRNASGLKDVAGAWLRNGVGLKRVFSGAGDIVVTASPPAVTGYAAAGGVATIQTNATIAQPTGGAEPYAYAWAKQSDDGGTWTVQNATSATTKFTCAGVGGNIEYTATFRCTVTDSTGGTGFVDVQADVTNLGSLYP